MSADTLISTIEKNRRETIRISLTTFKQHELVDARIFFDGEDGPTATRKHPTQVHGRLSKSS